MSAVNSTGVAPVPDHHGLHTELDQLIPPPSFIGKRLVWGVFIVAVAAVFTYLNISGWIYPRPTYRGSAGSGFSLVVDQEQQWVTSSSIMPNLSSRAVRITAIALDAPGATLVDSGVIIEPKPVFKDSSGDSAVDVVSEPMTPSEFNAREQVSPLPIMVEPGETARVVLRFRPTNCADVVDPIGAWGVAQVSVDFGDGAFPPFGHTVRLDEDPIRYDGEQLLQLIRSDETIVNSKPDGTFSDAGLLTTICEELQ